MCTGEDKQEKLHACSMTSTPEHHIYPLHSKVAVSKGGRPLSPTGVAARDDSALQVSGFQAVTVWHPVEAGSPKGHSQSPHRAADKAPMLTPDSSKAQGSAKSAHAGRFRAAQLTPRLTAAMPGIHPSFSAATQQLLQAHHQLAHSHPNTAPLSSSRVSSSAVHAASRQDPAQAASPDANRQHRARASGSADVGTPAQAAGRQQPFQYLKRTSLRRTVQGTALPAVSPAAICSIGQPLQQLHAPTGEDFSYPGMHTGVHTELTGLSSNTSSSVLREGGYTEAEASFPGRLHSGCIRPHNDRSQGNSMHASAWLQHLT